MVGFLGAIVFAGLVLIIQSPDFVLNNPNFHGAWVNESIRPLQYFQLLLSILAITVILSATLVIASMSAVTDAEKFSIEGNRSAIAVIEKFTVANFVLFLVDIYLILVPAIGVVAQVVFLVALAVASIVFLLLLWAISRP